MPNKRKIFYEKMINKNILDKNSKVLIVGATNYDADIFKENYFKNVTIANLSKKNIYQPFEHIYQDLRQLSLADKSFDFVVANACIHHTSKPHNAILEMYRVSKNGILVIEGNDSSLIKITNFFNLSQDYEISAVLDNNKTYDKGGVDNSIVPNFVYRWTEREIRKLFSSYEPQYSHKIDFFYDSDFDGYKKVRKLFLGKPILFILEFLAKIYFFLFFKEQNLFCFFVNKKKRKLKSWLKVNDENNIELNKDFLEKNKI
tara:strand:- start:124 stop:900 length:777 start_codon:yes stop_codon:yes gene_type:complete